jgi:hypothetical protein
MPQPRKDQKKIAQQYAGNLQYFNKLHPLRRARMLLLLLVTIFAMAGGAFYLVYWRITPTGGDTASNEKPDDVRTRHHEWFNSAGGISQAHSRYAMDCEKCHDPNVKASAADVKVIKASLDARCEVCHNNPPYTFHQTNVAAGLSCTDCHHEHLGTGPMQPVADINCTNCHGDAAQMAQAGDQAKAAGKVGPDGKEIYFAAMQPFHLDSHLTYFQPPRPAAGYTKVIKEFAETDAQLKSNDDFSVHPDFQVQRDGLKDPNTLKFNHRFHLSGRVLQADGKPLACETCHQTDSTGAYMQPITYEKNCQECHKLQMDVMEPNFLVPHPASGDPNANAVRNFIIDLGTQYANYAVQEKGLSSQSEINQFVGAAMRRVQAKVRNGISLENQVFGEVKDPIAESHVIYFGDHPPEASPANAPFKGCAECHELSGTPGVSPGPGVEGRPGQWHVTPPVTPDRWYVHAKFNHAAHAAVRSCEECHDKARDSSLTSDILLPDKASCVKCHSPQGGVASTCATCHDFHNQSPAHAMAGLTPLRKMMLGTALPLVDSAAHP